MDYVRYLKSSWWWICIYIYIHLSQKGKNPSISVYRCSVYTHIYPKKKQHQYQELDPHVSLLNSHVSPGEIGAFPAHLGPILRGCWGRGAATSALRPEASWGISSRWLGPISMDNSPANDMKVPMIWRCPSSHGGTPKSSICSYVFERIKHLFWEFLFHGNIYQWGQEQVAPCRIYPQIMATLVGNRLETSVKIGNLNQQKGGVVQQIVVYLVQEPTIINRCIMVYSSLNRMR